MSDKARSMVLAPFVADALALGPHWIYDQERIAREFGRVDSLRAPGRGSQHQGKPAGAQTHYGDQALILLDSVASCGGFDLADFTERWQRFLAGYEGYFDQATRGTLRGLEQGLGPEEAGSWSRDLAGAARIGPVLFAHRHEPDRAIEAARSQTRLTHNTAEVIEAAELFGRAALAALEGAEPVAALEAAASRSYEALPAWEWLDRGLALASEESVPALGKLGLSCHVDEAFPGTVQVIARHRDDPVEGLIQCVMAGGDSAARAMLVGLVLGAGLGRQAVPEPWLAGLRNRSRIEEALERIQAG